MEREPMRQRSKSSNNVKKQFLKNQKSQVQKRHYRNQAQDPDLMFHTIRSEPRRWTW